MPGVPCPVVHRPAIGRLEGRQHLVEVGLEARAVSGLISFSGSITLRAQGLLTLIRSQTLVSPARKRLIMVGSLVRDSALTVAPFSCGTDRAPGRSCSPPSTGCSVPSRAPPAHGRVQRSSAREGSGPECRLLHEVAAEILLLFAIFTPCCLSVFLWEVPHRIEHEFFL